MLSLCKGDNEPPDSIKANYLVNNINNNIIIVIIIILTIIIIKHGKCLRPPVNRTSGGAPMYSCTAAAQN